MTQHKCFEQAQLQAANPYIVEQAAKGEPFVIAKAGKPMVKVMALNAPEPSQIKRFGFMAGQIQVPDDFDRMDEEEIVQLFEDGA